MNEEDIELLANTTTLCPLPNKNRMLILEPFPNQNFDKYCLTVFEGQS